jgi:hypothetical protein
MDSLDWVPLSERHLKIFGVCNEAIGFLRQHDMINKPAGEIRQFLLTNAPEDKRDEWYQQWYDTRHTPETYEKINRRIMKDYIASRKYRVVDSASNTVQEVDTIEQAYEVSASNKKVFLDSVASIGLFEKDGKPYDIINTTFIDDIELAKDNYLKYNERMFHIEEIITTTFGDTAVKRL